MKDYMKIYQEWLSNPYFDEATKAELRAIEGNEQEIKERFYMDLEFGTAGLRGIILTGAAKEKPEVAEVLAVGPGGLVDGKEVTMTVKVGDKVITSKYAGTQVKLDGEEVTIVRQNDILAIVE